MPKNQNPDIFGGLITFHIFLIPRKLLVQGTLSDSTLGSFSCDLGLVYAEDDHAIVNKWLLLTAPEDNDDDGGAEGEGGSKGASARPGGPPAGYLQV